MDFFVSAGKNALLFKIAENFWFLIFCTHNKQWWIAK